jgi:hypothetical protein
VIGEERKDVLGVRRAVHPVVRLFGKLFTKAVHDPREPADILLVIGCWLLVVGY